MTNKAVRSSNKKKSLCEKSMKILANLIKVSSLSLASMSLRTTTPPPSTRLSVTASSNYRDDHPAVTNLIGTDDHGMASVAPDHPSRQMSKKPEIINKSKLPNSYLVDPNAGKGSSHMLVQDQAGKNNVDSEASDYIQRFHEKNRKLSKISSSYIILPPPPPPIGLK